MAPRRVNPKLLAAIEATAIEPLDYETPGRVVEVPVPAEHFTQSAPQSRFDVVREYLEANRQTAPMPVAPEVDMRAAADADARRDFGGAMLAAGQAFTGNRRAVAQLPHSNTNEAQALAEREARKRELAAWAAAQERRRMSEAELLSRAAAQPSMRDPALEERKLDIEQQKVDIQRAKANRPRPVGGVKKDEGKTLPVSEVGELSSLPVAEMQVDRLADEFKRLDMGGMKGRAGGAITDALGLRWTDSAEYNAAASLAMQAAGKIMEGGKLAAGDEMKYRQMLPRPGDSDDVVRQKVAGMKDFLRALAQARAKGLQESGYNVPPSLFPQGPKADPMVSVRRKADGKVLPLPKSKADTLDKDKYEVTP